ncbi:WD40-like Beta Propeller Repeat [Chryseolinea serpens]|uniref:WD40-like Beta Propeller Repeat n=2 Tax=Chryseolinea serpens TaxID=947013 RepID=A0A1M5UUH9_9BACT|nr:WD40-like Beta Propeller Repeat [Chryseolinea serpens]
MILKRFFLIFFLLSFQTACSQSTPVGVAPSAVEITPHIMSFGVAIDVSVSKSGKDIAIASKEGIISIFRTPEEIASGQCLFEYPKQVEKFYYQLPAKILLFANDEQNILVLSPKGNIDLRDKRSGDLTGKINIPGERITALEFDRKRRYLLVGTEKGKIQLMDPDRYTVVKRFNVPGKEIISLAANDKTLLCGDQENNIHVIDMATGKITRVLKGHRSWAYSLDISMDGKYAVSGAPRNRERTLFGEALLWDLSNGQIIYRSQQQYLQVLRTKFTADDTRIVIGHLYGLAVHSTDGKLIKSIEPFEGHDIFFDFIPGSNAFAASTADYGFDTRSIKIIHAETLSVGQTIASTAAPIWNMRMSPDGSRFIFNQDQALKSFNLSTDEINDLSPIAWANSSLGFSPDDKFIFFQKRAPDDQRKTNWMVMDLASGEIVASRPVNSNLVTPQCIGPDLQYAGYKFYDEDQKKAIFQVVDDKMNPVQKIAVNGLGYSGYEFTPVPRTILESSENQMLRLISLEDTSHYATFRGFKKLGFDGNSMIVYETATRSVKWVSCTTFKTEREIGVDDLDPVKAVVSPGKDQILFWGGLTVQIYDIQKKEHVKTIKLQARYAEGTLEDFLWSPNGKTFVICSRNGVIEFLDSSTGSSKAMLFAKHLQSNDYILMTNDLDWTGTSNGIAYMVGVREDGEFIAPKELAGHQTKQLLKAMLLD